MTKTLRSSALRSLLCAPLFLAATAVHAVPESAQLTAAEALQRLRANAGQLTESLNPTLGYSLLRAAGNQPLLQDNSSALPLERALNFLSLNGIAVGVTDPLNELVLARESTDKAGNKRVHLNQMHAGLPVFGARLVVHMNDAGITGLSGVFVPGLAGQPTSPATGVDQLRATALQLVAKRHREVQFAGGRKLSQSDLSIESTRLMYYRSGLLEGRSGNNYLAYEAFVRGPVALNGLPVRERVILDTANGGLINMIDEVHTQLNREIHTPTFATAPLITEGSALAPDDLPLVNDDRTATSSRVPPVATTGVLLPMSNLYVFAGGTYDLYKNMFGHTGYDFGARPAEEQVQHSVYLVNELCPNAYWDGASTNYCPAFDADDVVSHEWSHAYTEYTHGLIYQFQSGALNESYSDIFGEAYDLLNGIEGPLGITLTEGEYFENGGSRWVVGEDLTEVLAGFLLRDMWDPDSFGIKVPLAGVPVLGTPSPGSVITSPNYFCGTGDGGGVHTNSGVPNHAFAMLVDGKEYNGVTIPKIGMTKALHIYYQAMTQYQTPTTNFGQHADALEASCQDLIGAELNDATGAVSTDVIGPADCDAVAAATLATEMRMPALEKCGYQPMLRPLSETPAICASGESEVADFSENWDDEDKADFPDGWTVTSNFTGDNPVHYPWVISGDVPAGHDGSNAAYALNESKGGGAAGSGQDQSRSTLLESPELTLASDASFFKFTHLMQTELDFDGGNLKVSLNGGAFAIVPSSAMIFNPYNDEEMLLSGNTSPLAGEPGFTGTDGGESFSTWGTTIVDLAAIGAKSGDKLKFRFDYGQDVASGNLGWYLDDLAVVHCAAGKVASKSAGTGRFGGALGLGLLLPLALFGLRRRRSV